MASESLNSVKLTGRPYIDGLLWGDKWTGGAVSYNFFIGAYYFNSDRDFIVDGIGETWFTHEGAAVTRALRAWSAVTNINFQRTSTGSQDIAFYNDDLLGALGIADTPSSPNVEYNTVVYNSVDPSWSTLGALLKGGFGYQTILHEIGHALGLAHPHDTGGDSTKFPGVSNPFDSGTYGLNQDVWTIMSYVSFSTGTDTPVSNIYGNMAGPMALDIAAIQRIYGADTNYHTGNNIYTLPTINGAGTYYRCIWDAGGIDTISASNATADVTIDLRWAPLVGSHAGGYLSSVDGIFGGCTIAKGAQIEHALGGAGDDLIIGNKLANLLSGGEGADSIRGSSGADTLRGGGGADTLLGGIGRDVFDFNSLAESGIGADRDQIADFSRAQGDEINLATIDANSNAAGDQAFGFIGGQGFSNLAGELRFAGGVLMGDTDGDGAANFEIGISNLTSLLSSDIVL